MKANSMMAMCKALTDLVDYLNKEVQRTSKCERCEYNGKSFRGEPCYWHVDCGIEDYDKKASNNAMYLMKRFKLKEALSKPPRNCDIGTAEEQSERFHEFCKRNQSPIQGMCSSSCPCKHRPDMCHCYAAWSQMPYVRSVKSSSKQP